MPNSVSRHSSEIMIAKVKTSVITLVIMLISVPVIARCAPTFEEFAYRFWVENRLWFAVHGDGPPSEPALAEYLAHYTVTAETASPGPASD